MTEPVIEPTPPQTFSDPRVPAQDEVTRKNLVWGWALFWFFWIVFAGTFGVAYIWNWLS